MAFDFNILKGLFSDKGLVGDVMGILKDTGLIKDSEIELKAKQALMDYENKIMENVSNIEKTLAEDRKSAREREMEYVKAGKTDYTQRFLAWIAIIGFFGVMYVLFQKSLPEGLPRDAFLILLGTLTKVVSDLYNYYFGSSHGSEKKNDIISKFMVR